MTGRQASSLRGAIETHEPRRGKRYSSELKGIIEFARSRRAEGTSWAQISEELGVAFETLRRWCIVDVAPSRAMVPVQGKPSAIDVRRGC
jgi:hypothetical protein